MRHVRVFKVEGRWWWWCRECWGGDCVDDELSLLDWRRALRLAMRHARLRHPAPGQVVRYLSEPPC